MTNTIDKPRAQRGRPVERRLSEMLSVVFALWRAHGTTNPADLARLLSITEGRVLEILNDLANGVPAKSDSPSEPIVSFYSLEGSRGDICATAATTHPWRLRLTTEQANVFADAFDLLGFEESDPLRTEFEDTFFPTRYIRSNEPLDSEVSAEAHHALVACARSIVRGTRENEENTEVEQPPVTFKYRGENDTLVKTRRLVPLSLRIGDDGWLIDGYDLDARAARTFRAEGMSDVKLEDKPVRARVSGAERPDMGVLRLTCTPLAAKTVLSWEGAVAAGENPDDHILVDVPYFRADWLPRHVLALGCEVTFEDRDPGLSEDDSPSAHLRAEMRDTARRDLDKAARKLANYQSRK